MTAILLENLNDRIIRGEKLPDNEVQAAYSTFLDSVGSYHGHGFESNPLRSVYWHTPSENGKYPRNFMGVLPKTAIFADNFLELEILRFLYLYSCDPRVDEMCGVTLERLSRACIGRFCEKGECVGASISALRFLSAVKPDSEDTNDLASKLIAYYNSHPQGMAGYSRNLPRFYVFLALSDIQSDNAKAFLTEKTDFMKTMLTRGCLTGPAVQDTYNVRLLYILRNALSKVDGYAYVRENPVYIRGDGRCVCSI